MKSERIAGVLIHPTSLPSKYGIGDLGKDAYKMIDFLEQSGQKLWQVFPLGPTGYGDSPYQCFSAFAGNHLLISPDNLIEEGLLSTEDTQPIPGSDPHKIDYGAVINYKTELLKKAYETYKSNGSELHDEISEFCENNKFWIYDYALFMAVKNYHNGVLWTQWAPEIAFREEQGIKEWSDKLADEINYHKFIQYLFSKQWMNLKKYANEKGIKVMGDLPIFIAYDSADLWANKDLFSVDDKGNLETVAGVPPDYFSETGQLWGNPLYRWDIMEANGFQWWKERMAQMFELVDIVRIDHFRGFEAYWEIPGDAETAIIGKWIKAPGAKLFNEIRNSLGDVPIVAEDLGVITKEVTALREQFGFPGMKILQFAFGKDGERKFLPHNYGENYVVYSGSHDNETTKGFFDNAKKQDNDIYEFAQKYLNYYGDDMRFAVIIAAYSSVANTVVIPMQDILNLGNEARMNFPGKLGGNWAWRFTWDQVKDHHVKLYKEMCIMYDRPFINDTETETE
ncbi:MAG: 4-alpha-glucanotransferase [Melioribacteraceae bacterium]|nr:4-alpha-glucanotransferase [Melioribacteraceae bacterium]MCF8353121.1 4-alpha-glucanotransferase [Melioribacteraceae bacterium]MCF8392733.1 4-alpha-glucanotransferase [Melioribacteraceae bacterium]MCF8418264.1 4-alpha-glucanotransferase [Melioribacteraceae bacterium]